MLELTTREKLQALFFLALGLGLVAGVVALAVGRPFREQRVVYWLRFKDSVNGLERGTKVRYKGVEVGEVMEINVDPQKVEDILIKLEVNPGTPIRVSTRAFVAAASLVGPFSIELHQSRSDSPMLPAESEIPAETSRLARILETGTTVGGQFVKVMENFEGLTGPEMKTRLENLMTSGTAAFDQVGKAAATLDGTLQEAESLLRESREIVAQNREPLSRLVANLDAASEELKSFLRDDHLARLSDGLQKTLASADREFALTNAKLRDYLEENPINPTLEAARKSLDSVTLRLEQTLAMMEREGVNVLRGELGPTLRTLRESTRALTLLARRLQADPSLLLFSNPAPEVSLPTGRKAR